LAWERSYTRIAGFREKKKVYAGIEKKRIQSGCTGFGERPRKSLGGGFLAGESTNHLMI